MTYKYLFMIAALCIALAGWAANRHPSTPDPLPATESPAETRPVSLARPADLPGESIYQVGATWTDQGNRPMDLASFHGEPVVISMIFTRCGYACPTTVRDMKRIETELKNSGSNDIHFVLVTFDSDNDTPAELHRFARAHDLDLKRWTLLNGRSVDVRLLAAVLGVRYKQETSGFFSHSNVISILDRSGVVVHRQEGLGADPSRSIQLLQTL